MKEKKIQRATVGEVLKTFAENTTAHGCGSISRSKHKLGKLIWSVIFISCICVACQGVIAFFVKYFAYPTTDIITLERKNLEIPSVTICSLFPFTLSSMMTGNMPDQDTELSKLFTLFHVYDDIIPGEQYKEKFDMHRNRIKSNEALFENGEEEYKSNHEHDLDSMLELCFFNGKPCNTSFFTEIKNVNYQKCFTFNGAGLNMEEMTALRTDPNSGLSLVLFLDAQRSGFSLPYDMIYNPENPNSGTTGVHLTIHSPQTMPFPSIEGFDIPPGYSTTIGLRPIARQRLPEPYGVCTKKEYMEGTHYRYSELGCLTQCVQKEIMNQCGCISSFLPYPNDTEGMVYCGKFDLDNFLNPLGPNLTLLDEDFNSLECEDQLISLGFSNDMADRCPQCLQACNEMKYELTIAQASWPFKYVQETFLKTTIDFDQINNTRRSFKLFKDFIEDWPAQKDYIIDTGMVRQNFLRANIYFKDFTVETTKETIAYGLNNLMSDVGGTLGFYVGISIVTMCEFLNLLWKVIGTCVRRCKSAGAKRSSVVEVSQGNQIIKSQGGKNQYHEEFTKNQAHFNGDSLQENDFTSAFKY